MTAAARDRVRPPPPGGQSRSLLRAGWASRTSRWRDATRSTVARALRRRRATWASSAASVRDTRLPPRGRQDLWPTTAGGATLAHSASDNARAAIARAVWLALEAEGGRPARRRGVRRRRRGRVARGGGRAEAAARSRSGRRVRSGSESGGRRAGGRRARRRGRADRGAADARGLRPRRRFAVGVSDPPAFPLVAASAATTSPATTRRRDDSRGPPPPRARHPRGRGSGTTRGSHR